MIIRKMTIRNFGKIHDQTFELSPGINVLYGENESGKTTFHTFIKSMFYGIERQRGRAAKNDVYTSYEPWENPGEYGGILWFDIGEEKIRLTRNFSREHPYGEVFSETTGAIADTDRGSLEQLLGDVSEAVYDNTVSIGQLKSVTGKDLVRELQNYMASYQGTGDKNLDLQRASQFLKMTRKGYQSQAERHRKDLQSAQDQVAFSMEHLEDDLADLRRKNAEASARKKQIRAGGGSSASLEKAIQNARSTRFICSILFTVLIAACILTGILAPVSYGKKIIFFVVGLAAVLAGLLLDRRQEFSIRRMEHIRKRRAVREEEVSRYSWEQENLREIYEEKARTFRNLKAEYLEYEGQKNLVFPEEVEASALTLALETIESLSGSINARLGNTLRERTSDILCDITGGKYEEVLMDENFHMSVNTEERTVPLERLSRGTLEQIYFALRMAAGDLFSPEEPFPVILDDVFGMYDEERLSGVLHWLDREKRQIIISTCNRREMDIMAREGIPFTRLYLQDPAGRNTLEEPAAEDKEELHP